MLDTAALTPRMRRVTLAAPTLAALELRAAQDVGLVFAGAGSDAGRELRRRYTIRRPDPAAGTIVLDGVLHGHGPGAGWFRDAQPGAQIDLIGPRGKIVLDPIADWHLFAGDESGLPAFAELVAALPRHTRSVAVVEVSDEAEQLDLPGATVHWLHRGDAEPGDAQPLIDALGEIELPAGRGAAYLLGESRAMVALRAPLEARGVAHDATFLKGYWNRGRVSR